MPNRKLIAVVGPTASGKTTLAIDIAQRFSGEIIGADSRQVYRYMDIGTAKPTFAERAAAPHHLVDIVDPDEPFSLGQWLDLAQEALTDVWSRGQLPIVCGGTGQYVWALLEGWRVPRVEANERLRTDLNTAEPSELLEELRAVDPEAEAFIDPRNVRRVIRALEVYRATGKPLSFWRTKTPPEFDALVLGPSVERTQLYERIDARVDSMIAAGFPAEVAALLERGYARDLRSMSGIGYRQMCEHLAGEVTLEDAVERTKTGTHGLARHQNSWFKPSDERIHWGSSTDEPASVERFLHQGSSL